MAPTQPKATWWRKGLLIAAPVLAVAVVFVAVTYLQPPPRLLTDDGQIAVHQSQAFVRMVLWTTPREVDPTFAGDHDQTHPAMNAAGDEIYFTRRSPGHPAQLYVSYHRKNRWTPPTPLNALNSKANQLSAQLSPDGRFLLFCSDRPGGFGGFDLYASRRTRGGWSAPFNLGSTINSSADEIDPALSPDGLTLCFASNRFAGQTDPATTDTPFLPTFNDNFDLFTVSLTTQPDNHSKPWKARQPEPLQSVNSPQYDAAPAFSPAGDFLYFASTRPGGRGGLDLYRCRWSGHQFAPPENLGSRINSSHHETSPFICRDGFSLLFSSNRPGPAALPEAAAPFVLFQADSREVYARPLPRRLPLAHWTWWALAVGLALLMALALYIHEGGYRRLDLLKKCLLISLALHVIITVLLSLVMVSQNIIEIVAPDAGLTTAVNLNEASQIDVKLQTRQTLTDMPVKVPQLNPTSMQRRVAEPVPQVRITPADMPASQIDPGRMVIVRPAAPLPEPARSVEAVAPQPLDFFSATPDSIPPPPQPVRAVEQAAEPRQAPRQPPSRPVTVSPVSHVRPVPAAARVQPTQPVQLALLPSNTATLPPAERIEHFQPNAPTVEQRPVQLQPHAAQPPVIDTTAHQPTIEAPADRLIAMASSRLEPQPRVTTAAAPATAPSQKSLVTAQAVTPRIDLSADVLDVALPDSQVSAELDLPQLARLHEIERVRRAPRPAPTNQPFQPREQSEQKLAAAKVLILDPQLLKPLRAAEQPLPEVVPDVKLDQVNPIVAMEPATARLYTSPITIADLDASSLVSPASLFQRSVLQRQRLLAELGGTEVSQATVERALRYFARTQESDGRWTYLENQGQPTQKGRGDLDAAMTGLAALCFLACDHTPDKAGPYQAVIDRALAFLLSIQKSNGDLRFRDDRSGMYSHAIATLALSEAALMTANAEYRQAALRAAAFIIDAQHPTTGGWRYRPHQPGDTSVFGWQIMALHSCEPLGLTIPESTREGAIRWLVSVSDTQHGILSGYQKPSPTRPMTAQAVFTRILLGEPISPQRRAVAARYLLGEPLGRAKPINYYYAYYGSLCMLQLGGDEWRQWNHATRDFLIKAQVKGGPLDGSWDYRNSRWGSRGGRIYTTAMATLTLEVYYRYLPMYKNRPIRR